MHEKDELDLITENYYTKKVYSPRLSLSDEFDGALTREIVRMVGDNVDLKRVSGIIAFETHKRAVTAKKEADKAKKEADTAKKEADTAKKEAAKYE